MTLLSHLLVSASTDAQRTACVAFYSCIGFTLISTANDASATDTWLHLFDTPPTAYSIKTAQDIADAELDNPARSQEGAKVALRIVLAESLDNKNADYDLDASFARLSELKGADLVLGASVYLISSHLKEFDAALSAAGFASVLYPLKKGFQTLVSYDPVGNLVCVSDAQPAPFVPVPSPRISPQSGPSVSEETKKQFTGLPTLSVDELSPHLDAYLPTGQNPITYTSETINNLPVSKKIGVLTSGGDSSGMNAAVRSVARIALQRGCVPFAIHEGYEGLVEGGDMIRKLGWGDVRGFLTIGGTVIGTARSARFRTREGRLMAAYNMIKNGIDALVVCGGDGSLTGANLLRSEWKGLCDELVDTGKLTTLECEHLREHLTIVGLVGSIDNDMSCTDITIGAVTSLHRICEALDSLTSTAQSHQRAFVVEVMGRHCGWLALMAAISVGADWVFLPERPPPIDAAKYGENWEEEMCERLSQNRKLGCRVSLVIICEGAIDQNLKAINPDYVKSVLESRLGLDTRVTTLGHIQRGGAPCAYDRYLATVQGVEAVEAVLRSTPDIPAPMIGMNENKITATPLMDAVQKTQEVAKAIAEKDFKRAMDLRDPEFSSAYKAYIESHLLGLENENQIPEDQRMRIGIIHTGAPAGGMNAATRAAARLCLNRGHVPLGIKNGFSGLVRSEVAPISWQQVINWQSLGGSELGTNRDHPTPVAGTNVPDISDAYATGFIDCGLIAYALQKHNIQALMIIGGFEAFTSVVTLNAARQIYPAFCIPMVILPATVSNNVPGTDVSIGSDTALNTIVECADRIKLSATASQKRVFVVEVQGGNCGYLAVMGGLASGATTVYIPEEGISLDMLQRDAKHLNSRYLEEEIDAKKNEGRIIFRAEAASSTYTTQMLSAIFKDEGKGLFDSRTAVLGHLQQGGIPSPLDRIRATRMAVNCIDWIQSAFAEAKENRLISKGASKLDTAAFANIAGYNNNPEHAVVVGVRGSDLVFTPVEKLLDETDLGKRRGTKAWWMGLMRLIKVLSKYYYEPARAE
ncbi:6-phosphofructokinase, alpha subunit [Chytriomyces hyalinus]|nr:6-phosphofructokinase, alpha subunit [Chytriomyces hyalinus]